PADWVHKTMKCKHCGMVLQARSAASSPTAPAAPTAGPKPAQAPPPSAERASRPPSLPVALDSLEDLLPTAGDEGPIIRTPYRRPSGGWLGKGVLVAVLLGTGLAIYLARHSLFGPEQRTSAKAVAAAGADSEDVPGTADSVRPAPRGDLPTDAWCPRRALLI